MWNLPPPPGFQGLREDLPLTVYEQILPHWRQPGATYFVTFRLADSLPQAKLRELRALKAELLRVGARGLKPTLGEETPREVLERAERWLDQGMGSCVLRSAEASAALVEVMHRGDGADYELGCYVVMPNHVHAIVRPINSKAMPLEGILRCWKGGSAYAINLLYGRTGTLWQRESFDTIIRDEEHLWRVMQYIGRNPRNAGLSNEETRLWIRPSWVELGWNFELDIRDRSVGLSPHYGPLPPIGRAQ